MASAAVFGERVWRIALNANHTHELTWLFEKLQRKCSTDLLLYSRSGFWLLALSCTRNATMEVEVLV